MGRSGDSKIILISKEIQVGLPQEHIMNYDTLQNPENEAFVRSGASVLLFQFIKSSYLSHPTIPPTSITLLASPSHTFTL